MSDGGITVTKTTTGSIFLQDIKVMVHHQVPTYIPADQALNSTDLHRALNSKMIFQLLNTMRASRAEPKVSLEDENQQLREALQRSTQQNASLQQSVDGLARQMESLTAAVAKIGTATIVAQSQATAMAANPRSEVVGGDIPMFIPDAVMPSEVKMTVEEVLSDSDGVSDARSRLRQLRKGQG